MLPQLCMPFTTLLLSRRKNLINRSSNLFWTLFLLIQSPSCALSSTHPLSSTHSFRTTRQDRQCSPSSSSQDCCSSSTNFDPLESTVNDVPLNQCEAQECKLFYTEKLFQNSTRKNASGKQIHWIFTMKNVVSFPHIKDCLITILCVWQKQLLVLKLIVLFSARSFFRRTFIWFNVLQIVKCAERFSSLPVRCIALHPIVKVVWLVKKETRDWT